MKYQDQREGGGDPTWWGGDPRPISLPKIILEDDGAEAENLRASIALMKELRDTRRQLEGSRG